MTYPHVTWRMIVAVTIGIALLALLATASLRAIAARPLPDVAVLAGDPESATLVVLVHGLTGARSREGLIALARQEYPAADLVAPLYFENQLGALSNADAYHLVDALEVAIHREFQSKSYERVVLIGHSMGASLLRKALVWAHGEEDDRPVRRGARQWVGKAERLVSLAGINRGWTLDPRPRHMSPWRAGLLRIGDRVAAVTGTGQLTRSLRRGSPFVSDLRVQWMRVARRPAPAHPLPPTTHLLGTRDDVVNQEDSRDLCAATGVQFVTLENTGHADIATALTTERSSRRAMTIRDAVAGRLGAGDFDAEACTEIRGPERLVFIVHGIRDYADWGEALAQAIETNARTRGIRLVVEPAKYGWFPMAPFLLKPDRQDKVRWFMDQYTDALATYPDAREVDFIGHSNGTYILGAALARYRTITIRNAYLAGSVLPQRFPWQQYVPARVQAVRNVVAAEDWVVAIFPRLFEQIAEWADIETVEGVFDLGAAGFRGFLNLAGGAVRNVRYAPGEHGIGVDIAEPDRRDALVAFAVEGASPTVDRAIERAFGGVAAPQGTLDVLSRVSWLIWLCLLAVIVGVGVACWRVRWWAGVTYALFVVAVLNSI